MDVEQSRFRVKQSKHDLEPGLFSKVMWSFNTVTTVALSAVLLVQEAIDWRIPILLAVLWFFSLLLHISGEGITQRKKVFMYILFLLILIFSMAFTSSGIKAQGIRFIPIIVLMSGLTLGKTEIWMFGFLASLGTLALVYLEHSGVIAAKEPVKYSSFAHWIIVVTGIVILCLLEYLSVEKLRTALERSNAEAEKRRRSELALQETNDRLIEVARFQSHMVRGPLASVLGIINLLKIEGSDEELRKRLFEALEEQSNKLDDLVHLIVHQTNGIEEAAKRQVE